MITIQYFLYFNSNGSTWTGVFILKRHQSQGAALSQASVPGVHLLVKYDNGTLTSVSNFENSKLTIIEMIYLF